MSDIANTSSASGDDVASNNEVPHEDPGAYPIPFGRYAGQRLDTVPTGLRWWATQDERRCNSWYAAIVKANKRYEEFLLDTLKHIPSHLENILKAKGSTKCKKISFGGLFILRSLIQSGTNTWSRQIVVTWTRYTRRRRQAPSKYGLGSNIRDNVYKSPGFIRFCLDPAREGCPWYYRFKDLVERYRAHLQTHRREYRRRRPPNVQNPTGELLGKWDEGRGSAEPDDDYERDGFIVDDDEEEETHEMESCDFESGDGTDDLSVDLEDKEERSDSDSRADSDGEESVSQAEQPSPSRTNPSSSQRSESCSDSADDDMPLNELRDKVCSSKQGEAEVMSPNNCRRSHRRLSEDSDTTAKPTLKRLKRKSSEQEFRDVTHSHLDVPKVPQGDQLSQSVRSLSLSQESAASPSGVDELPRAPSRSAPLGIDDDEKSDSGIYMNAAAHWGKRYRLTVVDSVVEF